MPQAVRNPFTPTFGVSPPLLVGREEERASFAEALDEGPGAPGRAMLLTGARGSGKTVMLNALEEEAAQRGWLVVSETSRPGVAAELARTTLPRLLREHHPQPVTRTMTGGTASVAGFGGGVTRQVVDNYPVEPTLRSQLEALTDALAPHRSGVLISLDEVHTAALEDLRQITQAVQHAFRQGREVAFVGAGLRSAVQEILTDTVITFLRRAERFTLGAVAPEDVRAALREPVEAAGRSITPGALEVAAEGTKGYPFLVQLVGYHAWAVDRASAQITVEHARAGVERAVRRVGRLVHEPALGDLSEVDRTFLRAMSVDDGPSRISAIAERLGADGNYASQYRLRLIAAELIEATGHGRVDFTLPYLRDYLREHIAAAPFTPGASPLQRRIAGPKHPPAPSPGSHPLGPAT